MRLLLMVALICVLCIPVYSQIMPNDIRQYIFNQCAYLNISASFVLSILQQENKSLDAAAVHINEDNSIDYGLWQLNSKYLWTTFIPNYWHDGELFNWRNPYHNSYIALRHIRYLFSYFKSKHQGQTVNSWYWFTAMAYNCGVGAVDSGKVPQRTLDYAARVMNSIRW
jgi:hypothetical protein